VGLVAAAFLAFLIITSFRSLAGFYTDYLWFKEVHFTGVFRGVLGAKFLLAIGFTALFFALLWVNLTIADRIAPRFRTLGPEDELVQRYRDAVGAHAGKVRIAVAAMFALLMGVGTASHWNDFLLFRNRTSFGVKDPLFKRDVGFFVFQLPFLKFVVDWLFVAIVITAVISVVGHYLNGGIRLQAPTQRVTPQVKAHISVLLGALALVKAAQYRLDRYELDLSTSHVVHGATYTAVHAQLPAKDLLTFISVVAAVLFVVNIRFRGWTLPVIAVALWGLVGILVGAAYPAFIQKVRVEPDEAQREKSYIQRNITSTRAAYGLDKVQEQPFAASNTLSATDLANNADTIRNVRLWDPAAARDTYQRLQEIRSFYQFNDVDVDRYQIDGQANQALVSVRQLNPTDIPDPTWVNRHVQFTHGYGAVLAPANAVTSDGKPDFSIFDVPPQLKPGVSGLPNVKEPRVYYGEGLGGYAIVHTGQPELDFQDPQGHNKETTYSGSGGVPTGSAFRRLLFALRFGDANFVTSGLIKSESRVIFVRDIGERVRKAAPFLHYDADPYAVLLGDGRIVYVQDAYTTTSRYPYAEQADKDRLTGGSGLRDGPFNYVRNSVKVVIDAYNGSMKFYVMDEKDPLIRTYRKAFPRLFTSGTTMDENLRAHLRYPEDLFRVQTNMYGRYHITNPSDFYSKSNAWNISQDPGSGELSAQGNTSAVANPVTGQLVPIAQKRMDPTYLLTSLPDQRQVSFLILQPFVPVSTGDKQQNLTAFMTAGSDPTNYGNLKVFVTTPGQFVDGPAVINARINQTPEISRELTLLNANGSKVVLGNVLVIPIEQSLLYIQPLYVKAERNGLPQLKDVIVVYGDKAIMRPTLKEALAVAIPGSAPQTLEQQPGSPNPAPAQPGQPAQPVTPAPADQSSQQLVVQAQAAFKSADDSLKQGDLAAFQQHYKEGRALLDQAQQRGAPAPAPAQPASPAPTTVTTAAGSA